MTRTARGETSTRFLGGWPRCTECLCGSKSAGSTGRAIRVPAVSTRRGSGGQSRNIV